MQIKAKMHISRLVGLSEKCTTRTLYSLNKCKITLNREMHVPILAYHEISNLPENIAKSHPYNVSPKVFEEQMRFLSESEYSVVKLEDVISSLTDKSGSMQSRTVVLTFDDGYKNFYDIAFPILRKNRFPATVFLASDYIDEKEVFPWLPMPMDFDVKLREVLRRSWLPLSWREICQMSKNNISFGSHTASHTNLRYLDIQGFESEVKKSQDTIWKSIGIKPTLFSFPFSFPGYAASHREIVKETTKILKKNGFVGACTTLIGTNSTRSDVYRLKRIQIKNTDKLIDFRAKIEGAYNWCWIPQALYQVMKDILNRGDRAIIPSE